MTRIKLILICALTCFSAADAEAQIDGWEQTTWEALDDEAAPGNNQPFSYKMAEETFRTKGKAPIPNEVFGEWKLVAETCNDREQTGQYNPDGLLRYSSPAKKRFLSFRPPDSNPFLPDETQDEEKQEITAQEENLWLNWLVPHPKFAVKFASVSMSLTIEDPLQKLTHRCVLVKPAALLCAVDSISKDKKIDSWCY